MSPRAKSSGQPAYVRKEERKAPRYTYGEVRKIGYTKECNFLCSLSKISILVSLKRSVEFWFIPLPPRAGARLNPLENKNHLAPEGSVRRASIKATMDTSRTYYIRQIFSQCKIYLGQVMRPIQKTSTLRYSRSLLSLPPPSLLSVRVLSFLSERRERESEREWVRPFLPLSPSLPPTVSGVGA